jgi:anti-sigma regulatory factor (Ser/Thr protein kinase)
MTTRSKTPRTLAHDALLYESRDELLDVALPFLVDGARRGEAVFCAARRDNLDALRASLGSLAAGVDFWDAADWYRNPVQTLEGYRSLLRGVGGRPVRVLGEVAWQDRSPAGIREWARYESALNVAFAGSNAWIVCPYDSATLPDTILSHAAETHPTLRRGQQARRDHGYVEPSSFAAVLDAAPLEPAPRGARSVSLHSARAGRRFARESAVRAGVDERRLQDLVLAVSEVATNALVHGRPPIRLLAWTKDGRFLCQVDDAGPGFDPHATWPVIADSSQESGRGLWLARALCDLVEIRSGAGGTIVRLHVEVPSRMR